METTTLRGVWYRSRPIDSREVTMKAMEDRGTLTVSPGRLVFAGAKGTVEVAPIGAVAAKRAGRDIVNRWITVTYGDGDGETAMFVDGRLLGWSGILGGNKRLRAAIEQAAAG